MRGGRAAIAALALLCSAVWAAPAGAGILRGVTGHGLRVKVKTDPRGALGVAIFNWRVRPCTRRRYALHEHTAVTPPPRRAVTAFRTSDPYSLRQRGLRIRVVPHSVGRRRSLYRWDGTFSATATIMRHGRVLDRCHFPRRSWQATAPRARLHLSSDPRDYILAGRSYSYATPGDSILVNAGRGAVTVGAGPWELTFQAPKGRALHPGRYRHARRAPFAGSHPGIELMGDGRGCNEITGEFTVKRVRFDRHGLRAFKGSFVQHCEGDEQASRGTFSYRR